MRGKKGKEAIDDIDEELCRFTLPPDEAEQLVTVTMIRTNGCIYSDTYTADDERCILSKHVAYKFYNKYIWKVASC